MYKVPNLATDSIVTKGDNILLITRGRDPFKGMHAFPGGFVDYGEDPEDACLRELKEECDVDGQGKPELICVAGAPSRDPRKHVVSIVYNVDIDPEAKVNAGDDAATAKWYNIYEVRDNFQMAFDHKDILNTFMTKKGFNKEK